MNKFVKKVLMPSVLFVFYSCANMSTPPAQITGAYISPIKYENYTCNQLGIEISSLSRRENQLVIAQEQRLKSSQTQAFWLGYGTGDGIEASELANVRGEREAVISTMETKKCDSGMVKNAQSDSP